MRYSRMTAADQMRLDNAESRVADARYWGYDPEQGDLDIIENYRKDNE